MCGKAAHSCEFFMALVVVHMKSYFPVMNAFPSGLRRRQMTKFSLFTGGSSVRPPQLL